MFKDLVINRKNAKSFIETLFVFAILILISTLLLRFLWNESLVKHITVLKPINGFVDALVLSVALSVLKCC